MLLGRQKGQQITENGRQIVKCTTWTTDCSLSEKRLMQLAKKESTIWEKRISKELEEDRKLFHVNVITFSLFVEKIWFMAQIKEKEIRETTQVIYNKNVAPYISQKAKYRGLLFARKRQYILRVTF